MDRSEVLSQLLSLIDPLWHEKDEITTPYDLRHFLTNVMAMCRAGPDSEAHRICIADLSDVFFKPMSGERDRILRDLRRRFSDNAAQKFGRAYFKRYMRQVCPPPQDQVRDFLDWYLFWSAFPHPSLPGQAFFVEDSWKLFLKECKYVQLGFTSDAPGMPMYAYLRTNKFGRDLYRCLRSNSAVEGWHNYLIRNSDFRAKAASPRVKNAYIRTVAFRFTVKAAVRAGVIPPIRHYRLHLRDRLADVVRGTPLERMRLLQGWRRVDQSRPRTVPRGVIEGMFDSQGGSRQSGALPPPLAVRHSMLPANKWVASTWGHEAPSNLQRRSDLGLVLQQPGALCVAHQPATKQDCLNVSAATGVLPTPGALTKLPLHLEEAHRTRASLNHLGHSLLQARLQSTAGLQASVQFPRPVPGLGHSGLLPVGQFGDFLVGRRGVAVLAKYAPVAIAPVQPAAAAAAAATAGSGAAQGQGPSIRRRDRERKRLREKRQDPNFVRDEKERKRDAYARKKAVGLNEGD